MLYEKTEPPNTQRHTRARLLLMKGTPVAEVAELLGHKSAATMLPYFLLRSTGRSDAILHFLALDPKPPTSKKK